MNIDVKVKKSHLAKFPEIRLDGTCVETVEQFNYLGITIDRALKLDTHLNSCIRRAQGRIYMLGKLRACMNKFAALNIFKCMVLPYIEYGNCFLLGSEVVSRKKLQKTQNRGLKLALGRNVRFSTNELHKEASLASWEVRSRIALTRLMFKYKSNVEHVDYNDDNRLTRLQSGPFYKVETPRTEKFKNSVSYMGRVEWNSLPAYIRIMDSYPHFKRAVKTLYNHRFFHSIPT